jgi:uncharacterized membrane protein
VSVLAQFRTAEEQVAKRLRELKPLVAEYHQLEQVAQRLGLNVSDDDATVGSEPQAASPKATRRGRRASTTKSRSTTKPRSAAAAREDGGDGATAPTSVAATQPRRVRSPRNPASKRRAGANRTPRREQDVLRLVNERPGITVSEIAKRLGVDATGLYRPVHKLEQRGAITKQGPALQPTNP